MNAERIKSMRDKANALDVGNWQEAAMMMREAAYELERVSKLKDAALEVIISSATGSPELVRKKMVELQKAMWQ